jgi:hypothetical protein
MSSTSSRRLFVVACSDWAIHGKQFAQQANQKKEQKNWGRNQPIRKKRTFHSLASNKTGNGAGKRSDVSLSLVTILSIAETTK